MKLDRKTLVIGAIVLVVLLFIGLWLFNKSRQNKQEGENILQNEAPIPTVDSSVKVDLKPAQTKGRVILSVKNPPKGTKTIDFELTYEAKNQEGEGTVPQGAIGQCSSNPQDEEACDFTQLANGKEIVLGTCSSGTCVYHQVVGPIKLSLKFSGSYGQRIFEKEYKI